MPKKTFVILLTYGEPENHSWLEHYRYSLSILRRLTLLVAKIPRITLPAIAAIRAWKRVREWKSHGVTSPLEKITREQVAALSSRLGESCELRLAYEFREPGLSRVLAEARALAPSKVVLVPLYTVDSSLTSGISKSDLLWDTLRHGDLPCPIVQVSRFNEDQKLTELTLDYVRQRLGEAGWDKSRRSKAGLLLGCHGTILHGPPGIDTGLEAFEGLYQALARGLGPEFAEVSVGWMNHKRGGLWTQPDFETAVRSLVSQGVTDLAYYPFGFLADADETTHESRHIFSRFPGLEVLHLPCMNAWGPFMDHLASRIRKV